MVNRSGVEPLMNGLKARRGTNLPFTFTVHNLSIEYIVYQKIDNYAILILNFLPIASKASAFPCASSTG